jgi:hypothetical protein
MNLVYIFCFVFFVFCHLKIFNAGLSDPAVEVEDVGLRVVVPHRRLVVQLKNALLKRCYRFFSIFFKFVIVKSCKVWSI